MKNQKLCEEWSKYDVPEDLWPGILCRLPVKSLLRFRSVAKSWLALIDDPEFSRLHLNTFRNNSDETRLFVVQNSRRECVVRCSETFDAVSGIIHTLGNVFDPGRGGDIVSAVDGLILLAGYASALRRSDLLWNPSIKKFRQIPFLPKLNAPPNSCLLHFPIGFGYDKLAKDYKVVKLIVADDNTHHSKTLHSIAVFTLGGKSWKIIKSQGTEEFNWPWRLRRYQRLYFQGSLYCVAGVRDLVTFELSSEVLSSISLPNVRHCYLGQWEHSKCEKLAVVDRGSKIAAFYTSQEESSMWVLDTESKDWVKRYTFQLKCNEVLYLKSNDILVRRGRTEHNAPVEDKDLVIIWWDQVGSYSPITDEYKILQEKKSPYFMVCDVYGFSESLILLK